MTKRTRGPITTHILDLGEGVAATGIPVRLERLEGDGAWKTLGESPTDADGRVEDFLPAGSRAAPGTYRLTFDVAAYFAKRGGECFYPDVAVAFRLTDPDRHHHVPLLLSAYGYSTYRGT